jgi:hypothetical protein
LQSFEEVEQVLGKAEDLETVYFEGNPMQRKQPALYRNKVKLALPRIRQIDASKLLKCEKWGGMLTRDSFREDELRSCRLSPADLKGEMGILDELTNA